MHHVLGTSTKIVSGGKSQAQELKMFHIECNKIEALDQVLINNSRKFLDSVLSSSDAHGTAKAIFVVLTEINSSLGNAINLIEGHKNVISATHKGTLENRK